MQESDTIVKQAILKNFTIVAGFWKYGKLTFKFKFWTHKKPARMITTKIIKGQCQCWSFFSFCTHSNNLKFVWLYVCIKRLINL